MAETWTAWTEMDCDTAARIMEMHQNCEKRDAYRAISNQLNRTYWAVRTKYLNFGPTFKGAPRRRLNRKTPINLVDLRLQIPEAVLIDRARRMSLEHTSITASFFGDPLPGYSALDRRCG